MREVCDCVSSPVPQYTPCPTQYQYKHRPFRCLGCFWLLYFVFASSEYKVEEKSKNGQREMQCRRTTRGGCTDPVICTHAKQNRKAKSLSFQDPIQNHTNEQLQRELQRFLNSHEIERWQRKRKAEQSSRKCISCGLVPQDEPSKLRLEIQIQFRSATDVYNIRPYKNSNANEKVWSRRSVELARQVVVIVGSMDSCQALDFAWGGWAPLPTCESLSVPPKHGVSKRDK